MRLWPLELDHSPGQRISEKKREQLHSQQADEQDWLSQRTYLPDHVLDLRQRSSTHGLIGAGGRAIVGQTIRESCSINARHVRVELYSQLYLC